MSPLNRQPFIIPMRTEPRTSQAWSRSYTGNSIPGLLKQKKESMTEILKAYRRRADGWAQKANGISGLLKTKQHSLAKILNDAYGSRTSCVLLPVNGLPNFRHMKYKRKKNKKLDWGTCLFVLLTAGLLLCSVLGVMMIIDGMRRIPY